jgi:cytochrome c oxidase assembly protein subunit 15
MATVAALGLCPALRLSPTAYRRVTLAALLALCGIVITGAAVRLTGSGLGCSDWPTCEADQFHAEFEFHPMVEYVNRLLTGAVSLAVILAVGGSVLRQPRRRDLTRWSWFLVAGVVAQILIGAAVTLTDLNYSVVGIHFLVSMVLVWAATVLNQRAGLPDEVVTSGRRTEMRWPATSRWIVGLGTAILLTGPVVTSAGPHAGDEAVERLPLDVGWTVRVHSVTVWAFLVAVVVAAFATRRSGDAAAMRRVTDLLIATVAQGAIGYAQYFSGVPPLLVGLHVAGATLVWVLAIRFGLDSARPGDDTAEIAADNVTVQA